MIFILTVVGLEVYSVLCDPDKQVSKTRKAAQQLSVWHCSCGASSVKVDIAPTEFGDTAAIDLFVLADYPGHLDPAGTF